METVDGAASARICQETDAVLSRGWSLGDCATSATHRNFFLDRTLSIVAGSLRVSDEVDTGCEGRKKPRRSAIERKVEVRKCRTLKEQPRCHRVAKQEARARQGRRAERWACGREL